MEYWLQLLVTNYHIEIKRLKSYLLNIIDENEPWKEFRSKISQALGSYEPCQFKNCSCFTQLVTEDLKLFQNGITKKMMDKARERYIELFTSLTG